MRSHQSETILRIVLCIVLFVAIGMKDSTAFRPAGIVMIDSGVDTLKVLGQLVDDNKIFNNQLSVKYAKMALTVAQQRGSSTDLVDSYKWIGKAYIQNQKDSSYYYYNLALQLADSCHLTKQKVHILYNLASLYSAAYNYKTAISLLDSSIRLAELVNDPEGLSNAYIALGNIKFNVQDYENARQMFETALHTAQNNSLYRQMGGAKGNLARKPFTDDTRTSVSLQKDALNDLRKVTGAEEEMAYVFINIGAQNSNPDSALFYYKSALDLAITDNLPKVLFGAYNNMAYSYLEKGDVQRAEACLKDRAIPVALEINDNDWLASLYDTYADVCNKKGDYKSALEFQKKAMKARDADYRQKGIDQVRLLSALLDLKNKELIIKNEEREILVQRNRLQQTELWLAIALLLIAASVFTIFILQQRNRARLQKEQIDSAKRIIEMDESEKGRTARELHDLTGQLVLGVSGTIENIDMIDPEVKEMIKDRIKELGMSIRQISHRMNRAMIEHFTFSEMISGLCADMKKLAQIKIDLEIPDEFPDLPNDLVLHFYRITQELLTNAGKYARNSEVKIKIFADNGTLSLYYSDNGPGFTMEEKIKPSMGILNIFERAKLVGGQANLTSAPGKGTSWEIFFPMGQKNVIKS
ncbi:MAG: tetratricopeptide repeat protein [Bacteroidetes bacterium]|nr:tetratricopeptide repeat protein [Bacteroidota bacterium]